MLPTLAWHFDEPFADASAIPSFYVARMSSQQVTVVLTGDGGDESFGGYQRYVLMGMAGWFPLPDSPGRGCVISARTSSGTAGTGSRARSVGRISQVLGQPVPRRYARIMSYFTPEQKLDLYTGAHARRILADVDSYELLDQAYAESRAKSDVCR